MPQFTDTDASLAIWVQRLLLGTVVNIMFSSADALCVVLAEKVTHYLKTSGSGSRIAQRMGGGVLVALGLIVALSNQ
ncbi:hypothetical protein [Antarcticimicrobium sediminis]|uniref:LysE type translocator n=1 Tax=Antarcticimicrobium sediminis TaxID=2546227 RepID=A0A4R5EY44_9RHOB|nr:hypothetical protein [Antarcticimicrobium sediminis]TDE39852.1 hypothetical protein E1B25_07365 [Antarcticimicrobium sediminis]